MVTADASNLGWGALHEGKPAFCSWSILEQLLHINCLEMMAVFIAINLPASLKETPCPGLDRQHDSGSLYQPTRQSKITIPLQDGSTPPVVGIQQTPLAQSGSCAGQIEPRGRHAVQRQCISRGMEITSSDGSNDLVCLREGRGGSLCLRRQLSLPNLFLETVRCPGPRLAQHSPVCLFSDCPAPSGYQTGHGSRVLSPPGGPTLEEPNQFLICK